MASTRNRNNILNYNAEQRTYKQFENYTLYEYSQYGCAYNTKQAGNGLMCGQIPANKLSYNAPDIESFLWGINSTNLVNPVSSFSPSLKCLETTDIYKTPTVYMPIPLTVGKNRPFPCH